MGLRKRQRMIVVVLALALVGAAAALVLTAMQDKIAFFVSPADIASGTVERGRDFRLGGLVVEGSIERASDGSVAFTLTDGAGDVRVLYAGILPDLFREGQGIVAQGRLEEDGRFRAREVLAKHDETYMPPEVADALKRSGHWQEGAEKLR
ncbi:cytochrome c maturation protein CcmE [Marinimicrococcus flavescens]|uniref:Cytochrome c-type biogenesis protein CcmE n=1 Tax=Marinimicrococcus flavescens TaxID=3031815 RepID=A0AAP3XPK6_9PROT|nr:cytochrome c maturation protein CcmE [Marinimicrococcus flavescens]